MRRHVIDISVPTANPRLDPQRLAWGVLLLSFALFCLICVTTGVGASYFLFQSTVALDSVMQVGLGTGSISGQAVRAESRFSSGGVVSTDSVSQVTLFFRDSQLDNRLIASVTLYGDTTVSFWQAYRPRFSWGSGIYGIELRQFAGKADVFVPAGASWDVRLTVRTGRGDTIYLDNQGSYSITASSMQLDVTNYQGSASLVPAGMSVGRAVPVGNFGRINYDIDASAIRVGTAYLNLLGTRSFQDSLLQPGSGAGAGAPLVADWACATSDSQPPSYLSTEYRDGRLALRLTRGDNAITSGATGCSKYFGADGIDVRGYNYLGLKAVFNLNYQSLSVCGFVASECPLMLRMDYKDAEGNLRIWYHGFYYLLDTQLNYPLQCDSCSQQHEIIKEKAWYTYDSGNLFNLIPTRVRPQEIISLQFYASGHQYDVFISDVSLLAGVDNPG
jgi:hypothetical protein